MEEPRNSGVDKNIGKAKDVNKENIWHFAKEQSAKTLSAKLEQCGAKELAVKNMPRGCGLKISKLSN